MKKYFFTGLIALLPLTITVWIIIILVDFLTNPFLSLVESGLKDYAFTHDFFNHYPYLIEYSARLLILIIIFCAILLIGFLANIFFVHSFFKGLERIFYRIPVVKSIYKTCQQVISTLLSSKKQSFQKVVLVPFPTSDRYCIGLVAGEVLKPCENKQDKELLSVLIPSSPTPISGFILMYARDKVIETDIKVEDALKYIISCGMLTLDGN